MAWGWRYSSSVLAHCPLAGYQAPNCQHSQHHRRFLQRHQLLVVAFREQPIVHFLLADSSQLVAPIHLVRDLDARYLRNRVPPLLECTLGREGLELEN